MRKSSDDKPLYDKDRQETFHENLGDVLPLDTMKMLGIDVDVADEDLPRNADGTFTAEAIRITAQKCLTHLEPIIELMQNPLVLREMGPLARPLKKLHIELLKKLEEVDAEEK